MRAKKDPRVEKTGGYFQPVKSYCWIIGNRKYDKVRAMKIKQAATQKDA